MFHKKDFFLSIEFDYHCKHAWNPTSYVGYGIYDCSVCRHEGNILCQMRQMSRRVASRMCRYVIWNGPVRVAKDEQIIWNGDKTVTAQLYEQIIVRWVMRSWQELSRRNGWGGGGDVALLRLETKEYYKHSKKNIIGVVCDDSAHTMFNCLSQVSARYQVFALYVNVSSVCSVHQFLRKYKRRRFCFSLRLSLLFSEVCSKSTCTMACNSLLSESL